MSKKHNNTQPSTAVQPQSKDELLNNALMEMEEIEQSVLSISQMSSQVSEQFSEIGNTVKNFGYGVSDFITKNRKSLFNNKEDAEFASDITEIASDLLGGAIDFVGGIFSDYKKGKQLKKLLIAKQEIANAKCPGCGNHNCPSMEYEKNRLGDIDNYYWNQQRCPNYGKTKCSHCGKILTDDSNLINSNPEKYCRGNCYYTF